MGLRIALVTLMLGLSLAFQVAKGGRVETFYTLIIVTYALTIPSAILLRALTSPSALTIFFWAQVGIDFLLETVLVARTGGIESPFSVLYVMTVAVASLVHRRRGTRLATATVMIYNTAKGLSIPPVLATNIVSRRKSIPTCIQKSIVRAVEEVNTRSKMAEGIVRA